MVRHPVANAITAWPGFGLVPTLATLSMISVAAAAQTAPPEPQAQAAKPGEETAELPAPAAEPEADVVVTARYGEALVEPEVELSETDIAIYGAGSIAELVQRIKPMIDASGDQPILLVNGKRVGGASGIAGFPPEALAKLAILPPEAAARYGFSSGQRVVNLVLKKRFASWNAEAGLALATAGGRDSEQLSVGRVAINGQTHWNAQVQISRDSSLLKSERRIPPSRPPVDLAGHIEGLGGGEIDPELSRLAGRRVTAAGIPFELRQPPTLRDFAATAGSVLLGDPNAYESLLPSTRSLSANIGLTRPLGSFSGSLNINASTSDSNRLNGLAIASFNLPAASPWSPFGSETVLFRSFDGARALRNTYRSDLLGVSMALTGAIDNWQTSFILNYVRGWSDSLFERQIDTSRIQELINGNGPSFNPYGPMPANALLGERNRSRSENINAQFNVGKAILALPAGQVSTNLSIVASRSNAVNSRIDDVTGTTSRITARRDRLNVQQTIAIPLTSRREGAAGWLGDLSLDFSAGMELGTQVSAQPRFMGKLAWSPLAFLYLRGAFSYEEVAPSAELLDAPRLETIGRVYDFVRQEIAEPIWITGGNPDLQRGSRRNLSFNAALRPFGQVAALNFGYQQQTADGGVASLPSFTPAVEAAFPERFKRDASGRLIVVDARPINIVSDTSEQFSTSLSLRLPTGNRRAPSQSAGADRPAIRAANPMQIAMTLSHRWQLKSELLTRPGLPVLDRLGGDGAQPRHSVSAQVTAGKRGLGGTLSGSWQSPAHVRNPALPDGSGDFVYPAMTQFDLNLFLEPEHVIAKPRKGSLLSNLRITLDVQNLFNGYRRVLLSDGSTPPGSTRDEIDPLGRVIRLTLRKRF